MPKAGSIASRVPKAVWVMRRSASISRPNEITGVMSAISAASASTRQSGAPATTCGSPTAVVHTAAMGIVRASPLIPEKRSPTSCVSTLYRPQQTPASSAKPMPIRSTFPCQGSVSSTTPASASAGQTSPFRRRLAMPATASGPRNSIATAVLSGMRSTAARKKVVMNPVTAPRASSAGRSRIRSDRSEGRTMTQRKTAPKHMRSQAVPAGPACSITPTESAFDTWISSIAATAIVHGGMPVRGAAAFTGGPPRCGARPPRPVRRPRARIAPGRDGGSRRRDRRRRERRERRPCRARGPRRRHRR